MRTAVVWQTLLMGVEAGGVCPWRQVEGGLTSAATGGSCELLACGGIAVHVADVAGVI